MLNYVKRKLVPILMLIVVVVVLTAGYRIHSNRLRNLPDAMARQVNFPVYYPDKLPANYKLDKTTYYVENGILFFTINDKTRRISVGEQALPKSPPDLSALSKSNPSFTKANTITGKSIIGVDSASQSPVAVVETSTTLISISGSKDTPLDIVNKLVRSLSSLPR